MTTNEHKSKLQMSFSYSAQVPTTAAYDGTTVSAPEPVFRKLAKTIDVHYAYRGAPGTIAVDAQLSTASGWRSTIPLVPLRSFSTNRYNAIVQLDLAALENRTEAAAAATGMAADQLTVTVIPKVTTAQAKSFSPEFPLVLTPLELSIRDTTPATVTDTASVQKSVLIRRTLGLFGRQVSVRALRTVSAALLLLSLLAGALLALSSSAVRRAGEGARIRRRYAALLLPVHPLSPRRRNRSST